MSHLGVLINYIEDGKQPLTYLLVHFLSFGGKKRIRGGTFG